MAKHEFGIMQNVPKKGIRYDEYEPQKYNCISVNDDYVENIVGKFNHMDFYWHTLDVKEKGLAYCGVLDASICRGFNPEITYLVPQTLHDHDFCIQTIKEANMSPDMKIAKKPEGLKNFEYHNAHSYWAYAEVCEGVFGEAGKEISAKVLADYAAEYGQEMADIIEDEFEEIYPDEDKVQTMSTVTLRELRRTNAPSVLVEVAYHDNVEDANWIKNNIQPIARALSRSLADYFGIPFVESMD